MFIGFYAFVCVCVYSSKANLGHLPQDVVYLVF